MKTKIMAWMGVAAAVAMVPSVQAWSYNPEPFTIATKGGGGMYTQMAGNFLIWQDGMDMVWRGYDLTARQSFPIATSGAMYMVSNESYAIWSDSSMMNWSGYELATKRRFHLSISDVDSMSVRLTGKYLVYWNMMDIKLCGVDLASGEVFDITADEIDSMSVRAAGDYVIWRTMMTSNKLAGYQLSLRQGFEISDAEMIDTMNLAMNDRFVAWTQAPADPTEAGLFCFDLAGGETILISNEVMGAMGLTIGGNYIVWQDMMGQGLFGFDGVTRELFEIASGNVDGMSLVVNEGYAVWRDTMNMRLYGFDCAEQRLIETGVESMVTPALSGSILFWYFTDIDTMTSEVRGFDLSTGIIFTVASPSSGAMTSPLAEGDYVVWTDTDPEMMDTQLLGARIWKIPNDRCEDAIEVTAGTAVEGDSAQATGTDLTDCGFDDNRDVWFAFRPAVGGEYTIDAHSDAFDTTLAAFAACGGAQTACNDDADLQTTDSRLVMTLVKGKRYLFRVAGLDGSGGPYELRVWGGSCKTPLKADLTDDCQVNLADFVVFAGQWLDCGLEPAELCQP